MITAINQSQPQFRARFVSTDLAILKNDAHRAENPRAAFIELASFIDYIKTLGEEKASLSYRSDAVNKYNLLLDGKLAASSNESFTDALRRIIKKKFENFELIIDKKISTKDCMAKIDSLALDA